MKIRATTASGPSLGGAPESGTAQNFRQRLGEVIRFHADERGRKLRDISRRCRVSIPEVESWIRGGTVPTGEQWHALCRGICRDLARYQALYVEARNEAIKERETITRSMERMATANGRTGTPPPTSVGTNLGDKLRNVQVSTAHTAPVPPARPAPEPPQVEASGERRGADGRRIMPPKPRGSMTDEQRTKRAEFVRGVLRTRPHAKLGGPDGVITLVRHTFGCGISPDTVEEIRAEVAAEIAARSASAKPPSGAVTISAGDRPPMPLQIIIPAPIVIPPQPTAEVNAGDVDAAVQLILGAIPNLQSLTITVDEHGDASVDYQVREVKVTTVGGSLKVRR